MLIRLQQCLLADWTRAADCRLFYREGQGPSNWGFYIKYYINIQIPIFIWDYDLNLGRKELGIVSIVREPNYPWFDRNSQPKPDRPRGKKWVGKNDGSHTSSKTIVACFTTADLTPAFITGPVEPGLMGEETTVCPLTPPTFSRTRRKTFFLKNLLILHSGSATFPPSYSYFPPVLLHTTSCTLPSMILPRFIEIPGVSKAGLRSFQKERAAPSWNFQAYYVLEIRSIDQKNYCIP